MKAPTFSRLEMNDIINLDTETIQKLFMCANNLDTLAVLIEWAASERHVLMINGARVIQFVDIPTARYELIANPDWKPSATVRDATICAVEGPLVSAPNDGDVYYREDPLSEDFHTARVWRGSRHDEWCMSRGVCHGSKASAAESCKKRFA